MYRITNGVDATSRRCGNMDPCSKKITTSNMFGTINATMRRSDSNRINQNEDIPEEDNAPEEVPKEEVPKESKPISKYPSRTNGGKITIDPSPPQPPQLPHLRNSNDITITNDQYIKLSSSLHQINAVSNNIKQDLTEYKKLTNDRIEKLANLFLSINK